MHTVETAVHSRNSVIATSILVQWIVLLALSASGGHAHCRAVADHRLAPVLSPLWYSTVVWLAHTLLRRKCAMGINVPKIALCQAGGHGLCAPARVEQDFNRVRDQ